MPGKLRNMTSVYITDGDRMLLLYRVGSRVVAPSWCGVGGHFEEVREEIGLGEHDLRELRLRYITLRNKNGEIRQNYYFFAKLREGAEREYQCSEGTLEWVPFGEVCDREMPFSAKYVLKHWLSTGRDTDALYGGVASAAGVTFTELEEF